MPDVPAIIHVGPIDWTITVNPAANLYGKTRHKHTSIVLCPQSTPSMRDSLLHETLHALCWTAGADRLLDLDKDAEERLIRLISPWLLALLRDNPTLVTYLTQP